MPRSWWTSLPIRHNVRILRDLVRVDDPVQLMVVVKADGYGHGMVEVADAARDAGADWLGVATIDEALALRAAGDRGPLLCWLSAPGDDFAGAVAAGVEVTAYTLQELDEIAAVARRARAAQGGHRSVARGSAPGGVGLALRGGRRARGRRTGPGHRRSGRTSWPATSRRTR